MFLRQLDLSTALRPSLYDDESLLFVQDGVGLYEGTDKIQNYQNGHAYLTSHRVCYVDNVAPRQYSLAVDLKEIERVEHYQGFLKSSPKITLFPKATKKPIQPISSPIPRHASTNAVPGTLNASPRPIVQSPAPPRDISATWICPICAMSNKVPPNFDPATANEYTPLSPCQTCGVKPPLVLMVKTAIAAISNRPQGSASGSTLSVDSDRLGSSLSSPTRTPAGHCPRCTFQNHPSLTACEVCGAPLVGAASRHSQLVEEDLARTDSPGPTTSDLGIVGNETIETIKFSFRLGGDKTFLDRLKGALVQRKWLLQRAPPIPKPNSTPDHVSSSLQASSNGMGPRSNAPKRVVGIAGLEQRGAELRSNNQAVIGTAFEDLEALMISAKEVIQMAERFARQSTGNEDGDNATRKAISDSASALGLVTKDMLGSGSTAEQLYVTELARDLAEFLTDDRKGVLRKEGGIISLIDLWQVFNRTRNGIELVSPLDFEKAANAWDSLNLPIRLRRFKSGLLVVQERSRTDEKTIASLLNWLREPQYAFPPPENDALGQSFGRGVTAQETAERFGWSVGVAAEELEMAEETGVLCRDQCLDGTRFWENHFMQAAMASTWG